MKKQIVTEADVLDFIKNNKGCSTAKIVKNFRTTTGNIFPILLSLERRDFVYYDCRVKRRYYYLKPMNQLE